MKKRNFTEEWRQNLRKAHQRRKELGLKRKRGPRTEETKRRISEARKGRPNPKQGDSWRRNWNSKSLEERKRLIENVAKKNRGKKRAGWHIDILREVNRRPKTEQHRKKLSESRTGLRWTKKQRESLQEKGGHRGERNGMFGRNHTEQSKERMRRSQEEYKKNNPHRFRSKEEEFFGKILSRFYTVKTQYWTKGIRHPFDFFIVELDLLIEYDGKYWHNLPNVKTKDLKVNELVRQNNLSLSRISSETWFKLNQSSDSVFTKEMIVRLLNENKI